MGSAVLVLPGLVPSQCAWRGCPITGTPAFRYGPCTLLTNLVGRHDAVTTQAPTLSLPPPVPQPSLDPPETKGRYKTYPAYGAQGPPTACSIVLDLPSANGAQVFRHTGWRPLRNAVYRALQRCDVNGSRQSAFASCGHGAYVVQAVDDHRKVRLAGSTCHDRFCTPCANERSRIIAANVVDHLGGSGARFVTLTTHEGYEGLRPAIAHLYTSFRRLQRSAFWSKRVTGGVAFLEIKWNPGPERWHPHLHAIVHGRYIPQAALSREWKRITGGAYIVDVRACKGNERVTRYVTKYASKPLNQTFQHDTERLEEAIVALKGVRMAVTFGGWRGVLVTDKPDEGGWINIGSLQSWLERAKAGDDEARQILHLISGTRTEAALEVVPEQEPRPPPPQQQQQRQPWLFDVRPMPRY